MVILVAFTAGMAGTNPNTEAVALVFLVITGSCVGYLENCALVLAPFCLKPEDIGLALGLLGTMRAFLSAIAQVVFVSIYSNKLPTELSKYVVPAVEEAGLAASSVPALLAGLATGNFSDVPNITPSIIQAAAAAERQAYTISFQYVYYATIPFGVLGIIAALNAPNTEESFNSTISRRLHGAGVVQTLATESKEVIESRVIK